MNSETHLDSLKSEGDINLSRARAEWASKNISPETSRVLEQDAQCFLHQSLSTPCLNVLKSARGSWIEDMEGRRYLDFHGNNVHHLGFSHPRVVAAITEQLSRLSFCTRRYTCEIVLPHGERIILDDDSMTSLSTKVARLAPAMMYSHALAVSAASSGPKAAA